ncbi:5-formyltetrahydrofolate cyclo-ligase [Novosphingobium pokkalii]|uniref:5-formyltetrahydrofolate cyclo-ligase n=1 Tax=Novosphingobium pokkalii TaxID=1770194 RepID=A0ABV7V0D8_9SPHN|nr:5-formyltetrahydrofolate cyclo-ligase [Novosphingobium pokkalii]GHC86321.1 5-formyltetrahydrofolate cyclo-ligase [Novosphingobium pokkalii]
MVGPSPPSSDEIDTAAVAAKQALRKDLRARRRAHVEALDPRTRALLFRRPPAPLLNLIPAGATVALYNASPWEAPTASYAGFFHEAGHPVALPWFAGRDAPMQFRLWQVPPLEEVLEPDPWGVLQPAADAPEATPAVLFVPLVGFTAQGQRLGQGGGHYDRWLEAHPDAVPIGMAWDAQCVDALPGEAHDQPLRAVVTPTRLYGPF